MPWRRWLISCSCYIYCSWTCHDHIISHVQIYSVTVDLVIKDRDMSPIYKGWKIKL